jgi:2-oxoglutarate ferredoxin oxidoreductase subunit beta
VIETDFVPLRTEIRTEYAEGSARAVKMHDGSVIHLRKVSEDYDPTDRAAVIEYLGAVVRRGEIPTGLLYLADAGADMHAFENTVDKPLVDVPYEQLCPGSAVLEEIQKEWW